MNDLEQLRRTSEVRQRIARSRRRLERRVRRDTSLPWCIPSWLAGGKSGGLQFAWPLIVSLAAGWWFSQRPQHEKRDGHVLSPIIQWLLDIGLARRSSHGDPENSADNENA